MNKQEAINAVTSADINEDGWLESIISQLQDRYAAGYLTAKQTEYYEFLVGSDEEFREKILSVMGWKIWEK